jgi:hypothetical protein
VRLAIALEGCTKRTRCLSSGVLALITLVGCSPEYKRVQECCAVIGWEDPITYTVNIDLKGNKLKWHERQVDANGQTDVIEHEYT